jgi:peptidylprolyl isomerase
MSSLAFSVGIVNPRKFSTANTKLPIKSFGSTEAPNISFSSQSQQSSSSSAPLLQQNVNPTLLGRREALGFGFSFCFLDVLLQPEAIAADNAAPCELTVAPSGLAFCDKVVGTGPEAVKGQLIKVIYSFIFLFQASRLFGNQNNCILSMYVYY